MDQALAQVEDLTRVVEKLVDLASVWGSEALMSADRIELWPLRQKVWTDIEPLAQERGVTARFQAGQAVASLATIYGSEPWLGRVFRECLESAVRSTPNKGVLEIEHRQMGPRALIVFRDCGVFAKAGGEQALPMESTPWPVAGHKGAKPAPVEPRRHAREEIGFKLSQHIIALHGMHNFLIDLPTGAPHRMDSSQLDIARAQQYVKDLAALMARARNRKPAAPAPAAR